MIQIQKIIYIPAYTQESRYNIILLALEIF